MVRKKSLSELEQAEIRLEALIEKRDRLNQEANLLRQERDPVHEKKREFSSKLREIKDKRAAIAGRAREHRAKRDALQKQAKALIEMKRKLRGQSTGSVSEELRALKRSIAALDLKQQTASLTLAEENELLEDLKDRMKRAKTLEALKVDQDKVLKEVRDIDASITELFAQADKEHEAAIEWSAQARVLDEEAAGLVDSISTLILEGDQKHEAYLEAKAKADEVHAKVVEMREKVLSVRSAKRAEAREARDLLRRQNLSVRRALLDKDELEKSADEALRALFQKGRVEIGR